MQCGSHEYLNDVECSNLAAKWEQYFPPYTKMFITKFITQRD